MILPVVHPPDSPAPLPALTARWTTLALGALPPRETGSTCDSCVQLPAPGEPMGELHYNPITKCCTHLPQLYNFQVGAILDSAEVSSVGRASVEARIAAGVGVTPHSLRGTHFLEALYQRDRFGRDPALLCPHFLTETGGCGVWQHRNATCTTWFCRYDRGVPAFDFWRGGMQPLLRFLEDTLSDWAVRELGAQAEDFGAWPDARTFYRACGMAVSALTWEQTCALGGGELDELIAEARRLHAALLEAPFHPTGMTAD